MDKKWCKVTANPLLMDTLSPTGPKEEKICSKQELSQKEFITLTFDSDNWFKITASSLNMDTYKKILHRAKFCP